MMRNEKESVPVATQITERMRKAIQKLLIDNAHIVMTDCIRDLIHEDLEKDSFYMSKKNYTETSIPKQQEPALPSIRLAQLKGSDNSALSVGEEALHLRVEYREAKWQVYGPIDILKSEHSEKHG